ncbi:MAG TPA: UbiA family prenyltransferase [Candidatus Dietzia intestinipullorum]|nr:UbiA family prenyltransferase [Candidatus Dietzia intestinipullorum]
MNPIESSLRVSRFVRERVPAHHAVYGLTWSVAAESGAALLGRRPWRPGPDTAARASALTLTLVAMRMLDDVKDLESDRGRHPDRPLVRGAVSVTELLLAAGMCGAAAVGLAARRLGPDSTRALVLTQAYGAALWPLDRLVRRLASGRPTPVRDAALAYPTQALGTLFLLRSSAETGAAPGGRRPLALVPVFAAAFLQFEIARKTRSAAPHDPADYSSVLPWRVCAASIAALGEAAVWGLAGAAAPERPRDRRSVVARAPLALTPLPVWVVLDLLRGTRDTPRTAPSVGLLLALYLAIPLITLEVQRT